MRNLWSTYYNSLKYILEQKYLSERQKKWVNKVQAYDFSIEYVRVKIMLLMMSLQETHGLFSIKKFKLIGKLTSWLSIPKTNFHVSSWTGRFRITKIKVVSDAIYCKDDLFGSQVQA